ncbi:MAG TPA: hypothetical protein VHR41_19170 [Gemmatimonadales bacterium]|jgi:hypothetical protein|nr:hypothetical protein [Gemmatimonadales bacterium]
MRSVHRLVFPLCFGVASQLSATDNPADRARAYVAEHTGGVHVVPSYARQTGLACAACHYQFLTLTPFGRKFKLNGYTLTNLPSLFDKDSSTNGGRLGLSPFSLLSAMATASMTHTKDDLPDTQNDAVMLPQELSGFLAGRISPNIGIFSQFTYAGADGAFGIDNVDIRYANKTTFGSTEMAYGVTLNNNPSVQDLWNTTPGWGFPFIGSEGAPGGAASTMIDGGLSQNVLGLGSYAMVGNLVYGEVSLYRSAFQGTAAPSSETGAIHGVAPYWRLALQKEWEHQYLMVGTFGLHTSLFPDVLTGPRDTYSDVGADAQFESKAGTGNVVVRGSWIHENQTLDATFAGGGSESVKNSLKVLRLNASYYPRQWLGVTGGYFDTRGSTDAGLYAPDPVDGSASGSPKTNGFLGEVDLNPWENTRLGLQYTAYSNFNGGKTNYDGSGRDASGNNTLFAFAWLAF